ncbi:MAG: hypothetical protein ACI9OJ_001410 [Myxococcota bacterium]|jgi:hypothetical protein
MIALILLSTLSLTSAPNGIDARVAALSSQAEVGCYTVAKSRRSTPIRENYFTYSEVVDRVTRGQYFFGVRVASENKVLVHSPNATGAVGIARFTFTRQVDLKKCRTVSSLVAPGRAELKGWGRPLSGEAAMPKPPAGPASNHGSHGCYQNKRSGEMFWASRVDSPSGGYTPQVRVIGNDGTELRRERVGRLKRLTLTQCSDL